MCEIWWSKAGNSMKDRRLKNELKECVPTTAGTKKFPFKIGKCTVIAERKQFPLILDHAVTVRESQGSTLSYMKGNVSWSIGKKTATSKSCQRPIFQSHFYTLLSHAKSCDSFVIDFWHWTY